MKASREVEEAREFEVEDRSGFEAQPALGCPESGSRDLVAQERERCDVACDGCSRERERDNLDADSCEDILVPVVKVILGYDGLVQSATGLEPDAKLFVDVSCKAPDHIEFDLVAAVRGHALGVDDEFVR